jgi:hypothetical protein
VDSYARRKAIKLYFDEMERRTGKRQGALPLDDPLLAAFIRYISERE